MVYGANQLYTHNTVHLVLLGVLSTVSKHAVWVTNNGHFSLIILIYHKKSTREVISVLLNVVETKQDD